MLMLLLSGVKFVMIAVIAVVVVIVVEAAVNVFAAAAVDVVVRRLPLSSWWRRPLLALQGSLYLYHDAVAIRRGHGRPSRVEN